MSTPKSGFNVSQAPNVSELEDQGAWVNLRDVEGEDLLYEDAEGMEKPVRILVAGSYSSRYRRASEAQTTRAVKKKGVQVTGGLISAQRLELAAACTLKWEGLLVGEPGAEVPLDCNKETAISLYRECPYIREQVETAMEDHASFFNKDSLI